MEEELPAKMEAKVDTLHFLTQPKEGQQQFKKKKQPELTENRTVWKSDNQGDKEETFIQTGRRGKDRTARAEKTRSKVEAGRPSKVEDCGMGQAVQQLAVPTAPHSHVDKPGGTVGERGRQRNPGIQLGGNKASNL